MSYSAEIETQMQRYYQSLSEKDRRRYAGIEAIKLGYGGISYIHRVLGCDYRTIKAGIAELQDDASMEEAGIRRQGGGRKSAFETIPGLDAAFLNVMERHTAGSPVDDQVKWTNLSRPKIANLLKTENIDVSVTVVDQLLKKHHYRRRRGSKTLATGARHPQRNDQFENIDTLRKRYTEAGNPVISMDTKKEN